MRTFLILALLSGVVILTGCKTVIGTEVSLLDIIDSKTKVIGGHLFAEVASCDSFEDSRKPSDAVLEAQRTIPTVFNDAKYIECYSKEFESYAHFSIPITLDKDADGKLASEDHINIISNKDTLLSVGVPGSIKTNLERVEKENMGMVSFDIKVQINVKNDTGKDFPFKVFSAYVQNYPYIFGELSANKDSGFLVRLSDVSVDNALQSGSSVVLGY